MNPSDTARMVLSAVVVLGFGGVIIAWMAVPPIPENNTILVTLSTALAAGYLQVLNYWFSNKPSTST